MCNDRGIGRYIVEARKKKGMSQKQLSEKAGVILPDIIEIEDGKASVMEEVIRIADVLEIPYFKLLVNKKQRRHRPKCNVDDCKDLYADVDKAYRRIFNIISALDILDDSKEHYKQELIYAYGKSIVEIYNKIYKILMEAKKEYKRLDDLLYGGDYDDDEYCEY